MRQTKLHEWHVRAGARMLEFGGWDMPVLYATGPREEHMRVRAAAGLFDIDHMGRFEISGPGALGFLQRVQTWDAEALAVGRAHYSMLCRETGGIIDDIFIYKLPDRWLMVVNASNADKDLAWLQSHALGFDAAIRDISEQTCMLALQGPASRSILQGLCGADLASFAYHSVARCEVTGASTVLCSTGYTGEPGFEMLLPAASSAKAWEAILAAGAPAGLIPCGLAARDSLRAEACLPLYGHEIDEETDPYTAGLAAAAVRLVGHEFIGKSSLARIARGQLPRRLSGFEMVEPSVPRQGYTIAAAGREVGRVTTGLFSPSTGRYLGMGHVEAAHAGLGQEVAIVIRDAPKAARIVERPFYKSPNWR